MGKSGNPWPRLTAPDSAANEDITVKIVVPTWGSLLIRAGEDMDVDLFDTNIFRSNKGFAMDAEVHLRYRDDIFLTIGYYPLKVSVGPVDRPDLAAVDIIFGCRHSES